MRKKKKAVPYLVVNVIRPKVKIVQVINVREYTGANGAKVKIRTLAILWADEERYGFETNGLAVDVQGDLSEVLLDTYIKSGEELELAWLSSLDFLSK